MALATMLIAIPDALEKSQIKIQTPQLIKSLQ